MFEPTHLFFEKQIAGISIKARRIEIEWKYFEENGKPFVGFEYDYDPAKDPWLFTHEEVCKATATNLTLDSSLVTYSKKKSSAWFLSQDLIQMEVKVPLGDLQKKFTITQDDIDKLKPMYPGYFCRIL